jgi:hypothetical protein
VRKFWLWKQLDELRTECEWLRGQREGALRGRDAYRQQRDDANRQRDDAIRERDAALRHLAERHKEAILKFGPGDLAAAVLERDRYLEQRNQAFSEVDDQSREIVELRVQLEHANKTIAKLQASLKPTPIS